MNRRTKKWKTIRVDEATYHRIAHHRHLLQLKENKLASVRGKSPRRVTMNQAVRHLLDFGSLGRDRKEATGQ